MTSKAKAANSFGGSLSNISLNIKIARQNPKKPSTTGTASL
jgi:hypothetical protein